MLFLAFSCFSAVNKSRKKNPMASVRKSKISPFWLADMRVWKSVPTHPRGGYISKTTKSTKVSVKESRRTAEAVADEMERTANELRGKAGMDRLTFEKRLESLMRLAGAEVPRKATTWNDFAAQYLSESDAGESSLVKYRGEIKQFADYLGARASHPLRDLTHEDITGFYSSLQSSGRTKATATNTTKTIKAVLKRAFLLGYLDKNPADLVKFARGNGVTDTSRQPFSRDEVARILAIVKGEERIFVLFGLTFGLRATDAARRSFEEIHEQDGMRVISFVPQKKSRMGRKVTLPVVGELETLIPKTGTGFITPSLAGMKHPGRKFETAMDLAGIDRKVTKGKGKGRSISAKTFHSLRHTASTFLMESGADSRMRQLVCDHDDPRMNAKYTHSTIAEMGKAITKALAPATKKKKK
jgi:integrase